MRVEVHPEAREEIDEAADYYDRQRRGLGLEWAVEFENTAQTIFEAPERWELLERGVRRRSFKRFPYCILYRVIPGGVNIVAVKHHSRHPDYWKHRLDN